MDLQLTTRSQEALSAAVRRAATAGQAQVEPLHVLAALLAAGEAGDDIAAAVLDRVGVDRRALATTVRQSLDALPSALGQTVQSPQLSPATYRVIQAAHDAFRTLIGWHHRTSAPARASARA